MFAVTLTDRSVRPELGMPLVHLSGSLNSPEDDIKSSNMYILILYLINHFKFAMRLKHSHMMHFHYSRRASSFMSKRGSVKLSHQTHKYRVRTVAVSVTVPSMSEFNC